MLFLFTGYVWDPEVQYDMGYIYLAVVGFNLAVNLLVLIFFTIKQAYVAVKKCLMKKKATKLQKERIKKAKSESETKKAVSKQLDIDHVEESSIDKTLSA